MTMPQETVILLREGDVAPAFDLPAHPEGRVTLADFRGKKNVVLAFYPKDDTPGCTREMCGFSADLGKFASANTAVLGISCDDAKSHAAFAEKHALTVGLLADVGGAVGRAYGAVRDGGRNAERILFVIDKEGVVRHIHKGMPDNAALLSSVQRLG
jgi:peroxiredoxin Q/BCP